VFVILSLAKGCCSDDCIKAEFFESKSRLQQPFARLRVTTTSHKKKAEGIVGITINCLLIFH